MLEKYTPLYLKYRPQSLGELVGQHSVAQTLINAIEHDRISHAYLFTGPRGTGKTSSARILAKSLNCQAGPTINPCQTCPACVEIKEGISPAVFELDAASNNSVDDARVLIERAPLVAQGGRNKLYIIDECHMLTKEAFNALLKTVEEPPPGVIFILATTEEHKVPSTIVSRCQRLMFKLVNQDEMKSHLRRVADQESINIDDDALELIARRSGGGLRDALGLLDQAGLLSTAEKPLVVQDLLCLVGAVQEDVLLKISSGIKDKDGGVVLNAVHSLLLDGREPAVLIQELSRHFLNLARAYYNLTMDPSSASHAVLGSPTYIKELSKQARCFDPAEIAQIVELLDKMEINVRRSSQPAMNLEMGLLSLSHRHDIIMLKELKERLSLLEAALRENGIVLPKSHSESVFQPSRCSDSEEISQASAVAKQDGIIHQAHQIQELQPQQPWERASGREFEPKEAEVKADGADSGAVPTACLLVPDSNSRIIAKPTAGQSANLEGEESALDPPDLDQLWSDLKDALQARHIPTFSLVATHAFPLAFEKNNLTIGVRKEQFQKMIEGKSDHIKAAFEMIEEKAEHVKTAFASSSSQPITIRVKVVGDERVSAPSPGRTQRQGANASTSAQSASRLVSSQDKRESKEAEDHSQAFSNTTCSINSAAALSTSAQAAEPRGLSAHAHSAIIGEAYRLFEGPGSRLIG